METFQDSNADSWVIGMKGMEAIGEFEKKEVTFI